ncbi:MAG: LCP family protein [Defluviitaleaceae bacterium]|nr:LCP family protein [Defluviitaleaceae bacterium]
MGRRNSGKARGFAWLYIRTVAASVAVMVVLGGAGRFAWGVFVQTPSVPLDRLVTDLREGGLLEGIVPAFDAGGGQDDDIFSGVSSPALLLAEHRRPTFFTFLIVGLTEGLNANTVMLAAYDGEARRGYIVSIPRDTEVDARRNVRKLSSAYAAGRLNGGGHEGGIARLKYEVWTLTGVHADFYVKIDYEAFSRVIDAVGGIEIDVPFHMRYDDPWQNLHINIPAGLQLLDGENALHFARYRMGNDRRNTISDYRRIEHQQQVIAALFGELMTPATILRVPEFISIVSNYTATDLGYTDLMWFANRARRMMSGSFDDALEFHTIPMLGTSGAPRWYELPDGNGIVELMNRTVNPLLRDLTLQDLRLAR